MPLNSWVYLKMLVPLSSYTPNKILVSINSQVHYNILVPLNSWVYNKIMLKKLLYGGHRESESERECVQVSASVRMWMSVSVWVRERAGLCVNVSEREWTRVCVWVMSEWVSERAWASARMYWAFTFVVCWISNYCNNRLQIPQLYHPSLKWHYQLYRFYSDIFLAFYTDSLRLRNTRSCKWDPLYSRTIPTVCFYLVTYVPGQLIGLIFKNQAFQEDTSLNAWPLKIGPIGCGETSVTNHLRCVTF